MKSVIMIAYGFPPEGNAGAYRPLRFVRHLPALGWQPTIVTLDAANYQRYDASLLQQMPDDIKVIRMRNRDPCLSFLAETKQTDASGNYRGLDRSKKTNPVVAPAAGSGATGPALRMIDFYRRDTRVIEE